MEMIRPVAPESWDLAGWGVSVLLVSAVAGGGMVAGRLAALGAKVAVHSGLGSALARLLEALPDAPSEASLRGVNMLVIDCDHAGGLAAGMLAFDRLTAAGLRMPVILISAVCAEQTFPVGREAPFHFRAPVSVLALRIGFELAFSSASESFVTEKGRNRDGAPFWI